MARPRKKVVPSLNPTELAIAKADVEKLANLSRTLIQGLAAALAAGFAFVVIDKTQIITILNESDPGIAYKVGLFLYYTSWVFGAKFDVDIEERVYVRDSARGILDWKTFGVLTIFTIVMLFFFWLHTRERLFGCGLLLFVLVNILGWKAVCRRIRATIEESQATYTELKDYYGLEKLRVVSEYMRGTWQGRRFIVMIVLAILLISISNAIAYPQFANIVRGIDLQGIKGELMIRRAPALFFLIYVLAAEGWMWLQRMRVHHHVNVLDEMAADFRLEPRITRARTHNQ
jgi:hypothetical protein